MPVDVISESKIQVMKYIVQFERLAFVNMKLLVKLIIFEKKKKLTCQRNLHFVKQNDVTAKNYVKRFLQEKM